MAQQATIECTITPNANHNGGVLKFTFSNGDNIILSTDELSDAMLNAALLHGLKQKLVDAAAISRNTDTGKPASVADKFDAVMDVRDRLVAGEWNKTREGGAGGSVGLLVAALMRVKSLDRPTVEAWLEGKTKEQQAALRANPTIAPIIAAIKAERDAASPKVKSINTDALLDDLG